MSDRYYRFGDRTVHLNGCVEVDGAYYGAPPGWLGQRVHVQWNDLHVRLMTPRTGQLLREHLRTHRGWYRIHDEDRPSVGPRRQRRSPQDVRHCLGGEAKYTKRYNLCRLLSGLTRHFLLMTATPHNGKDQDFQLFMALLDATGSRAARETAHTWRMCQT